MNWVWLALRVVSVIGIAVLVVREPAMRAFVGTVVFSMGLVAQVVAAIIGFTEGLASLGDNWSWVLLLIGPALTLVGWALISWARRSDADIAPPL